MAYCASVCVSVCTMYENNKRYMYNTHFMDTVCAFSLFSVVTILNEIPTVAVPHIYLLCYIREQSHILYTSEHVYAEFYSSGWLGARSLAHLLSLFLPFPIRSHSISNVSFSLSISLNRSSLPLSFFPPQMRTSKDLAECARSVCLLLPLFVLFLHVFMYIYSVHMSPLMSIRASE